MAWAWGLGPASTVAAARSGSDYAVWDVDRVARGDAVHDHRHLSGGVGPVRIVQPLAVVEVLFGWVHEDRRVHHQVRLAVEPSLPCGDVVRASVDRFGRGVGDAVLSLAVNRRAVGEIEDHRPEAGRVVVGDDRARGRVGADLANINDWLAAIERERLVGGMGAERQSGERRGAQHRSYSFHCKGSFYLSDASTIAGRQIGARASLADAGGGPRAPCLIAFARLDMLQGAQTSL